MGRHIYFRTPTKDDRKDIFDLYLGKVNHDPELDPERRRDELARITGGYSPAMIEQVCSMALTTRTPTGCGVELGRHRRRRSRRSSRAPRRASSTPPRTPARSPCTRRATPSPRTSTGQRRRHAPVDPDARGSLGHYMAREKEERFHHAGATRTSADLICTPRRDGDRARVLRRERHRRRRRPRQATSSAAAMVGYGRHGRRAVHLAPGVRLRRGARARPSRSTSSATSASAARS